MTIIRSVNPARGIFFEMVSLPPWLKQMPPGRAKDEHLNRFYIRLAALYASERGTLFELAVLIDVNYDTLKSQTQSKCRASRDTKNGIRRLLGDDFVPPDLPEFRRRNSSL
jgi:hypothetical protein